MERRRKRRGGGGGFSRGDAEVVPKGGHDGRLSGLEEVIGCDWMDGEMFNGGSFF